MIFDGLLSRAVKPSDPQKQGGSMLFGLPKAGIRVDEDVALNYSAVWAAVSMIAHTLGIVSWQVFERRDGRRERLFDHRVAELLNVRPNEEMTPQTFKQTLAVNALLWGACYAEVDRNGRGEPMALYPIPSKHVTPARKDSGRLYYEVEQEHGDTVEIRMENMFAAVGLSFDGIVGVSPIQRARESISMGLAMESYGASFFGNDARPSFVLETDNKLSEKAESNLKDWINRNHGGPNRKWKPGVLEEGLSIKQVGMPNDDAQFLESRKFQIGEIARWFNIPPHKIGDLERATFNNIDSRERMFVTEAILPWARSLEEEANRKLIMPGNRGRLFTKFQLNSLMRGDVQTRSQFYTAMFNVGAFSPNDIRILEDMNPVRGGDVRVVPGNMVTLDQAGTQMAPQQAMFDVFANIADRMLRREQKAVVAASGKEDFHNWVGEWYESHHEHLLKEFRPAAEALAQQCGGSVEHEALHQWATNHCLAAADRIKHSDDIEATMHEWSGRSRDVAGEVIDTVSEKIDAEPATE